MSSSVYPTIASIGMEVTRSPMWKTNTLETPSGREFRGTFALFPRYRYTLTYEFLKDTASVTTFRTLLGFFNLMRGSYDTFLFTDPDDCTATNENFGTGTGAVTQFQIVRTLGGFAEPVYDFNSTPVIKVNGVTKTAGADYNIGANGAITFTSAPAAAAALTWSGTFYWRCRFEDDSLDFLKFMYQLWSANKVSFRTVKP